MEGTEVSLELPKKYSGEVDSTIQVQTLMQNYRRAVKTSDDTRNTFLKMGQTQSASTNLGLNEELKKNALLRWALEDPKSYIDKRTKLLEIIKQNVDLEFQKVFTTYTDGENQLPVVEAKRIDQSEILGIKHW